MQVPAIRGTDLDCDLHDLCPWGAMPYTGSATMRLIPFSVTVSTIKR